MAAIPQLTTQSDAQPDQPRLREDCFDVNITDYAQIREEDDPSLYCKLEFGSYIILVRSKDKWVNASHILKLAGTYRQNLLTELQQVHRNIVHSHLAIGTRGPVRSELSTQTSA